jgi:hypothetical protein
VKLDCCTTGISVVNCVLALAHVIFLSLPLSALSAIPTRSASAKVVFAVAVFICLSVKSGVDIKLAPVSHIAVPASNCACVAISTTHATVVVALLLTVPQLSGVHQLDLYL